MPDANVGGSPSITELVERARCTFVQQVQKTRQALVDEHVHTSPQPASMPIPHPSDTDLFGAFNNAIVELVSTLEEACDGLRESCAALRDIAADNRRTRRTADVYRSDLERCRMDLVVANVAHDVALAELMQVQSLGKRHSFSATDPVCARCAALVAEANPGGNRAQFRIAVEGDACSKCGAVVCVRREDETDAQFRARLRSTSQPTNLGE